MIDYYYAPGMYYPYWTLMGGVAHNADADTDMGDLDEDKFFDHFPNAFPITRDQYRHRLARAPQSRDQRSMDVTPKG